MSTEKYTSKILALMDSVLIDFESKTFNHRTEWYLRQLPKWRALGLAKIGHLTGAIPDEWMVAFEQEVKSLLGHRLRQIEDPYTKSLKSEYTIEEP